jgi:1,4-alpha-glucan branching enzyme
VRFLKYSNDKKKVILFIIVWMGEEFGEPKEKAVAEAKLQWDLIENTEYEFNHRVFDYW